MEKRNNSNSQQGFGVLELLIVLFIIGLLAGVILPNIYTFFGTGNLAAASKEMDNVKTAALGYYGEKQAWPSTSNDLTTFVSSRPRATYIFDSTTGVVTSVDNISWSGISWEDGAWAK